MTIVYKAVLLRKDASGECWLESYREKVYPIGLSVRMWRIVDNGRILKANLLRRPSKQQLQKYK